MGDLVVGEDDPEAADVRSLVQRHLDHARRHTPPEDVHALEVGALSADDVTLFSVRRDGELLGVGALRQLDGGHAELKSMHTAAAARRQGVGRALVEHLVGVARARGCHRVSLETGAMDAFAASRSLYEALGFQVCEPFGDYPGGPNSVCMTLGLDQPPSG